MYGRVKVTCFYARNIAVATKSGSIDEYWEMSKEPKLTINSADFRRTLQRHWTLLRGAASPPTSLSHQGQCRSILEVDDIYTNRLDESEPYKSSYEESLPPPESHHSSTSGSTRLDYSSDVGGTARLILNPGMARWIGTV